MYKEQNRITTTQGDYINITERNKCTLCTFKV